MSREPQSSQLPVDVKDAPRRKYSAPRLKRLGSVRDLTLGSPTGKFSDGTFNMMNAPAM
jgi:hypothetical protein